ncbi:GNAT family N-acetyltransferase, partial [Accumulibacter sp.]|uniref:GNAT family N-acetyltransferase n=1 Tax=Accumulibacter sp. TaxID=2053492 RepID=UPI00262783FD
SVSPGRLLDVKHAIRSTTLQDAKSLAGQVLAMNSTFAIRAQMEDDWKRRRPVSPPEFPTSISATSAESYPITHNVTRQRFESLAGVPPLASLSYVIEGERVILDHTFVPDELRGRGIAAALARKALDEARQRRWKIVPRCSYVASFIQRHPEFADLVGRKEMDQD